MTPKRQAVHYTDEVKRWIIANNGKLSVEQMAAHLGTVATALRKNCTKFRAKDPTFPYLVRIVKPREEFIRPKKYKPRTEKGEKMLTGKFLIKTNKDIYIREKKTIPEHKTVVTINSKTVAWRDKSKVV